MPVRWQNVDIPLAVGLDTRTDDRALSSTRLSELVGSLPAVRLSDLQNMVFDKHGALVRARGATTYSRSKAGGGTVQEGRLLAKWGDRLVMADKTRLYVYSETTDTWADQGKYIGWGTTTKPRVAAPYSADNGHCDMARVGDVSVVVCGGTYTVFDGDTLYGSYSNAAASKAIAVNGKILVLGESTSALQAVSIDPTDLANTAGATPTASANTDMATEWFDVNDFDGTKVVYAYLTSSTIRIGFVDHTATFGTSATFASSDVTTQYEHCIAVAANPNADKIVALYQQTGTTAPHLRYVQVDDTLTQEYNATVDTGVGADYIEVEQASVIWDSAGTYWHAVWSYKNFDIGSGTESTIRGYHTYFNTTGTRQITPVRIFARGSLASHIFEFEGNLYVHYRNDRAYHDSPQSEPLSTQSATFILALDDYRPVGRLFAGRSIGGADDYFLGHPNVTDTRVDLAIMTGPLSYNTIAYATNDRLVNVVSYDVEAEHAYLAAEVNGALVLNGPMTWELTPQGVAEHGFLEWPENVTGATGTAGALTADSNYQFYCVYQYTDSAGRRQQSAGYLKSQSLAGSEDEFTAYVPKLSLTQRDYDEVLIMGYRSQANGTIPRLELVAQNLAITSGNSHVSLDFDAADGDIDDSELAVISTDELSNQSLFPMKHLIAGGERLYGVSVEHPNRVQYTKLVDNDGALEWNEGLYLEFPEDINAVAYEGSVLYAFADRRIYAVTGDGPDNSGAGSFSTPYVVVNGLGCSKPRTVVTTPAGVMFLSERGFWVVGQSGTKFIGGPVEDYWAQSFTAAVNMPGANRVRWIASSGRALDYDYELDQWSTHTSRSGTAAATDASNFYWVLANGTVNQDTDSTVKVSGGDEWPVVETNWIRPTTIAGFQRCRRGLLVGTEITTGHSIKVEVAYDYDETWTTVDTIPTSEFPIMRFRLPRQKFTAIKFRFTGLYLGDADPNNLGDFEITALGLEVGVKRPGGALQKDT